MFKKTKEALQQHLQQLTKDNRQLFKTSVDKDVMWETYLSSFPEETRQEHNCNCCRSFIKNYGSLVSIDDNGVCKSIWDTTPDGDFVKVFKNLKDLVLASPVESVFVQDYTGMGTDFNHQSTEDGKVIKWEHFYFKLPKVDTYVRRGGTVPTYLGEINSSFAVFKRSLETISKDSVDTVLELINQNSLYRGQEFKATVESFQKVKEKFDKVPAKLKNSWCWIKLFQNITVSRIRNSAIGTLLVELSEGKELDAAVTAFEKMVAPTNYKRPTALVTQSMIDKAKQKVEELGYTKSLGRKRAVKEDINVNNTLFVDRSTSMKSDDIFDNLSEAASKTVDIKTLSKVEEISYQDFVDKILPTCKSVELLFENRLQGNLMTLVAPVDKEAPSILKWKNGFSWSYKNAVTDSIKEKVKSAGGKVQGEMRCSLEWFNYDDLDLHLILPNREEIYYARPYAGNGRLDVDMNAGSGTTRTPVENIIFQSRPVKGTYQLFVRQFSSRETKDVGFNMEVECGGQVHTLSYPKTVRGDIPVAEINYDGHSYTVKPSKVVSSNSASQEVWGMKTNEFQRVKMVTLSPNHWEEKTGNKHLFFFTEKAKSEEDTRGIFNEFLKPELNEHRKVFEMLGSNMRVESTDPQLSGFGFSETIDNHVFVKVNSNFSRTLKIKF